MSQPFRIVDIDRSGRVRGQHVLHRRDTGRRELIYLCGIEGRLGLQSSGSGARRVTAVLTLSALGSGGVLLDAAEGRFSEATQRRLWALAAAASRVAGVREVVPGMNNLLVRFDALEVAAADIEAALCRLWGEVEPGTVAGKTLTVPVVYGGPTGEDLADWAAHCGLSVAEAVRRHAAGTYSVAAIGAMPGFPYLSGLDPALARPRRATPRSVVPEGAVIIGGQQAGIMPQTAPSGWHILGRTAVKLFDAGAEPPSLLQPGDTVRFEVVGIEP